MAIAAVIALSGTPSSGAADPSSSADSRTQRGLAASRVAAPEKCKHARKAVVFYRGQYHAHRARLGAARPSNPADLTAGCSQVRFLAYMWRTRAYVARVATEATLYFRKMREKTLKDFRVTPGNSAWRRAVQEAQKAYPGTSSWLLSCSSTEGGWGRWVPNSDGFPPGGWMQMYESTFWRMWTTAKADVTARGFRIPSSASSWYSPLGQALASAWGLTHGRRSEWTSDGC